MSGTRVITTRLPLIAPSRSPSSRTPRTTATPNSSDWSFIRAAATTLVRAIIDADRQVDPAGDDHDRLGDSRQGERQDRDGQALDAGDAVGRLDELGEDEQQRRGSPSRPSVQRVAARPVGERLGRRARRLDGSGRGAHRVAPPARRSVGWRFVACGSGRLGGPSPAGLAPRRRRPRRRSPRASPHPT